MNQVYSACNFDNSDRRLLPLDKMVVFKVMTYNAPHNSWQVWMASCCRPCSFRHR